MNPHDLEISNNLWAYARKLEAEHFAALKAARGYDVRHNLPWPCDIPVYDDEGNWSVCGVRGLCPHAD